MLSTVENDWKIENRKLKIVPKELPNWYGIEDIGFIWHNEWADPEIEYNGKRVNSYLIEESMWEEYLENGGKEEDLDSFSQYMRDNQDEIKYLIEIAC